MIEATRSKPLLPDVVQAFASYRAMRGLRPTFRCGHKQNATVGRSCADAIGALMRVVAENDK